ncbi:MAG: hypothetical protein HY709_09530 [Candidatus Latescibacteria bacterium]|nr:hypothetical protein [Candidatus Latescibacterota bacterium]
MLEPVQDRQGIAAAGKMSGSSLQESYSTAFDVVVVPDFSGEKASTFEARTLFFLASWIENAGRARRCPLHVACIGEPPPSVRRLAARSNASITVHPPLGAEKRGTANKLRGLEVEGREDRVLLLDADVLVLSDLSDLAEMGYGIAASQSVIPRVPERCWRKIYPALGMELPTERIASVAGELGYRTLGELGYQVLRTPTYAEQNAELKPLRESSHPTVGWTPTYAEQNAELNAMFLYYNAGVVFVPWGCGLRPLWEEHIRRIAGLFDERDEAWKAVAYGDQAGFATAVEFLKRRGVPFKRLPNAFHANWLHLSRRILPVRGIKLFHAFGIFGGIMTLDADGLSRALHHYRRNLVRGIRDEWSLRGGRRFHVVSVVRRLLPSLIAAYTLGNMLSRLYERHVAAALGHTGGER